MNFRLLSSIDEVSAQTWDALHDGQTFLRHAFLNALEQSGSVSTRTGWTPAHASLWEGSELMAAAPLYLKTHSWGEYVFDWAWAEASGRLGHAYYPKWLCAVPFSPVPGARLLARDAATRQRLLDAMLEHIAASGASSFHLLFPDAATLQCSDGAPLLQRRNVQFQWQNRGFTDFEAFLASLSHNKRKKIRQERRKVRDAGVHLRILRGVAISQEDWSFFYRCHQDTYARHGHRPYLSKSFFLTLAEAMPEHCVLVLAAIDGQPVACSLLLRDAHALYGRFWGAIADIPCLHFEACYYTPIEYAIDEGISRFEGGAQGEHKLARGLDPAPTHSLHWIADPVLQQAIARHLAYESQAIEQYADELQAHSAYRAVSLVKGDDPSIQN